MSGFREEDLPKPKYELSEEEFLEALKDKDYKGNEYLRRYFGNGLPFGSPLKYNYKGGIKNITEFLIVTNCKITSQAIRIIFERKENNECIYIIFKNSIIPEIRIHNAIVDGFNFNNCIIGNIEISQSNVGEIKIESNSYCGNVYLFSSDCDGIYISKQSKSGFITTSNNSSINRIDLNDNSESGFISLSYESSCYDISIRGKSNSRDIYLGETSQCNSIRIFNGGQNGEIHVTNNSNVANTSIENGSVVKINYNGNYGKLNFSSANVEYANFLDCIISSFEWMASSTGELYFNGCKINHLAFKSTNISKDSVLSFINTYFLIAQFQECGVLGQLVFRDIHSLNRPLSWNPPYYKELKEKQEFENNYNKGDEALDTHLKLFEEHEYLFVQNLENQKRFGPKSRFIVANSSMGKAEITGSDLTGFQFEYRDTKMLDMFINGTKLPKEHIKIFSHEEIDKQDAPKNEQEQKISVYNQLRKIMEANGNIVEATWYHAKAMEHQGKLLKVEAKEKGWFSKEAIELWNFRLNKFSNNHGESWSRAFLFIFIVSLLFYISYFSLLNHNKAFSSSGLGDFFGGYFQFLDLTHKINFMKEKPGGGLIAIDFFSRLFIGYGIYQFITAFRRHGRKQG